MSSGTGGVVALAATAGLAGSIQAAVMSELGQRVGIVPAVAVSVTVGLVCGLIGSIVCGSSGCCSSRPAPR